MTNYIWVTTEFEGWHYYANAPEEVSFLRNNHRHMFKVKVWIEVNHDDRDIEFFMFKRMVEDFIVMDINERNTGSCEMIANAIYKDIAIEYPGRKVKIEISEDGENGCEMEYE